jgi:hypothetical protein
MALKLEDLIWTFQPNSPAEQLRKRLAECRRRGLSFFRAWEDSLVRVTFASPQKRQEWLEAWHDPGVQMGWMQAYDRRPDAGLDKFAALAGAQQYLEAMTLSREPEDHRHTVALSGDREPV